MQAREVMYAAVGAPVVAVRRVSEQLNVIKDKLTKEAGNYGEAANKAIDQWAAEGEKLVARISEGKVVEEISQKMDLDQAKEQVGKLRDQLEDMLATWRHSFRPEKAETPAAPAATEKPAATPARKPAAKKPAAKPAPKTSAAKTTKSSQAAKTSSAKSTTSQSKTS